MPFIDRIVYGDELDKDGT